ncbi:MAG: cell wall hydrolase [Hyphomicrobiales bacterium]|nr:cell wall hydrolase [Hyphomicrobiales bacterium]
MLFSFTADAGQDYKSGATLAPIESRVLLPPADLVPGASALIGDFSRASPGAVLREARLAIGPVSEFRAGADEIAPRIAVKPHVGRFPEIVRAHKGDPTVSLRPGFETRLRRPGGLAAAVASRMLFHADESDMASTFSPSDAGPIDTATRFEPWAEGEEPVTTPPRAPLPSASPLQGGSASTIRPAAIALRDQQGATPATPRAVALSSSTPAQADAMPVEFFPQADAAPSVAMLTPPKKIEPAPNETIAHSERPDYAAYIGAGNLEDEKKCLAQAVYFEARSEPAEGQAAVAQVVLNRVSSGLYPRSICGVVFQNRHRYKSCQFSFACEGKSLRVNEPESWAQATRIASEVLEGKTWIADVGSSTHYHANYVRPRWAKRLKKMDTIGHHIFYRLRTGQT